MSKKEQRYSMLYCSQFILTMTCDLEMCKA